MDVLPCELSKTYCSEVFNNAFRLAGESTGGASSSAVAETRQVHADVSQASFYSQVRVLRCASYCIYIASPPGCVVPLDQHLYCSSTKRFSPPPRSCITRAGDRVGICLASLDANLLERGVVATVGSVRPISAAVALVRKVCTACDFASTLI